MSDTRDTKESLEKECEDLLLELNSLQVMVNEKRKITNVQSPDVLSQICKKRKELYEAHLKQLSENPSHSAIDKSLSRSALKEKLQANVEELQETLTAVVNQRQQMEDTLKSLQESTSQKQQLVSSLEKTMEEISISSETFSANNFLEELKSDKTASKVQEKKLMKQMVGFINEHFPDHSVILQEMIVKLLNKCFESANNPYVEVDEKWRECVEILHRTGIVMKHKEHDHLIRLTPFHL